MPIVAHIALPDGRQFDISTDRYSYEVKGFNIRTKSGQLRTVFGCRNAEDAFRTAKHLARKWHAPLPDPKLWKLIWADDPLDDFNYVGSRHHY